jgi:hypothetical protein
MLKSASIMVLLICAALSVRLLSVHGQTQAQKTGQDQSDSRHDRIDRSARRGDLTKRASRYRA